MARLLDGGSPPNTLPQGLIFNILLRQDRIAVDHRRIAQPRRMEAMRWGLIPAWYKTPNDAPVNCINGAAETCLEKPAFRSAAPGGLCADHRERFLRMDQKNAAVPRDPWRKHHARCDVRARTLAELCTHLERDPASGEVMIQQRCRPTLLPAEIPRKSRKFHTEPVHIEPHDRALWLGESAG